MNRNIIETVVGAVVLAVAGLFMVFAYTSADLGETKGYVLSGRFSQTNGLKTGADVRISGIKVGSVVGQTLNDEYLAVVKISIDPSVKLPRDTMATVASESLLGGRYISLQPGGDPDHLNPGDFFEYTQSSPDLESLIGQAIFSNQSESKNTAPSESPQTPSAEEVNDLTPHKEPPPSPEEEHQEPLQTMPETP